MNDYRRIRAIRHNSKSNNDESVEIDLPMEKKVIGKGTFAIVYKSFIQNTAEVVAIKEVLVDRTHKNRELEILLELNHPNIIELKYYFFKQEINNENIKNDILCLIMELYPETVYSLIKRWHMKSNGSFINFNQIKLFTFQIFRALAYLHARGIAHRDIKPSNLLVNSQKGLLKICDFGTAKHLVPNDISVSYICSRYYRAPELIVGCTSYTNSIDIWAAACVLTEFYSGVPLFKGIQIFF
jgi:glycogen synthase kinase 3 beta